MSHADDTACGCCLPLLRRPVPRSTARNMLWARQPCKVLLYPEEGWARSAMSSHWLLLPCWWSRSRCTVIEVTGARRFTTKAEMTNNGHNVCIVGTFKKTMGDPDFKRRNREVDNGGQSYELRLSNTIRVDIDNCWVVPDSPLLCKTYKAHKNFVMQFGEVYQVHLFQHGLHDDRIIGKRPQEEKCLPDDSLCNNSEDRLLSFLGSISRILDVSLCG